jgi:hypothetical protein
VCPVLGRTWGARGGGERIMPELAQVRLHGPEERDSLARSILAPPAGFEPAHTAPECNPAYSRYQQERGLRCMHGARMGRENAVPSFAIWRHRLP